MESCVLAMSAVVECSPQYAPSVGQYPCAAVPSPWTDCGLGVSRGPVSDIGRSGSGRVRRPTVRAWLHRSARPPHQAGGKPAAAPRCRSRSPQPPCGPVSSRSSTRSMPARCGSSGPTTPPPPRPPPGPTRPRPPGAVRPRERRPSVTSTGGTTRAGPRQSLHRRRTHDRRAEVGDVDSRSRLPAGGFR